MTALRTAALWIAALATLGWLLWRALCARRWPPRSEHGVMERAAQVVALVLALFGARPDRAAAQPESAPSAPAQSELPSALWGDGVHTYVSLHRTESVLAEIARALAYADEPGWRAQSPSYLETLAHDARRADAQPLAGRLASALDRARQDLPHSRTELLGILDAAEETPAFEAWLAGWVLRHADVRMSASQRAALYARIERHLRIAEALERALAQLGPGEHVPWRRMSSPPRGFRSQRAPAGLAAAAERILPAITLDAWAREGAIELVLAPGSARAELWRHGRRAPLAPSSPLRLGRLDVLAAPAGEVLLEHAELGRIRVPRGTVVHARGLPELLDAVQRARIAEWIARASAGDAQAMSALERTLPAAHALLREAELAARDEPARARLRTLLAIFDE